MPRSASALKWTPKGTPPHAPGTEMGWRSAFTSLLKRAHDLPHTWMRIQANHPDRLSPALVRRRLSPPGRQVQVHQVLSGTYREGDIPPPEIVTNEFEVDSGLVRLERQKIASGEIPLWDTWVRIAPPAVLDPRAAARQAEYDREHAKARQGEHEKLNPEQPTEEEIFEDEVWRLKTAAAKRKARRDREFAKADEVIAYRQALRDNRRIGEPGLKEWQVAEALRRIRESRERHQAFANGRSRS